MVNQGNNALDATFAALSDPTRRAILHRLSRGPATVHELREPFPISAPAISRHLRVLEESGLMTKHKEGRTYRCTLNDRPMQDATQWLKEQREMWNGLLDSLESFLDNINPEED